MPSEIGPDHELRHFAVPVQARPFRLTVGTRPTDRWLLPGPDGTAQHEVKRALFRERPADVLQVLPGAEDAVAAVAQLIDRESTVSPSVLEGSVQGDATGQLERAATAVQEDLCVLQRDDAGAWRLTAGCVCFPSHWRLADKAGQHLDAIHVPVPHYAERLAAATRSIFDRAAVADGAIWERFNWIITADDELFHPDPVPEVPVTPEQVPERLWLRTERQTVRAIGEGAGVVFAIRTFLTAMGDLTPSERAALATSLPGVSSDLARYRSALGYRDAVLRWLRSRESA